MPLYAYRCENCGLQFDQSQRFTDSTLTTCPECGEESLRKLYQPVGIVFKGSGFYATDHRSPSGQATNGKKSEKDKSDSAEAAPKKEKSDLPDASTKKETPAAEN
jgi:putative FmdB family regulatory protein